jgi:opacity protein-like surface antigen
MTFHERPATTFPVSIDDHYTHHYQEVVMRRRIVVPGICSFVLAPPLAAQPAAGTWELSLPGTAGSVSTKTEYSGSYRSGSNSPEAQSYLMLYVRPGYYIFNGLSLEPEIPWMAIEDIEPALSVTGNISYTLHSPESRVAPFVLVGYGMGNTIPDAQRAVVCTSDEFDVSVLNAGGGFKIFVGEATALRVEYRYQRCSKEESETFGPYTMTFRHTNNQHNVIFGFSFFL